MTGKLLSSAVALSLLFAASASAQTTLLEETGELTTSDSQANDGSYYDVVTITLEHRQRYRITVESDDFDTYLLVRGPGGEIVASNDDSRVEGTDELSTNSAINLRAREDGEHQIVVNSFHPGATGSYTVTVTPL